MLIFIDHALWKHVGDDKDRLVVFPLVAVFEADTDGFSA
jgi:hypothetical protein